MAVSTKMPLLRSWRGFLGRAFYKDFAPAELGNDGVGCSGCYNDIAPAEPGNGSRMAVSTKMPLLRSWRGFLGRAFYKDIAPAELGMMGLGGPGATKISLLRSWPAGTGLACVKAHRSPADQRIEPMTRRPVTFTPNSDVIEALRGQFRPSAVRPRHWFQKRDLLAVKTLCPNDSVKRQFADLDLLEPVTATLRHYTRGLYFSFSRLPPSISCCTPLMVAARFTRFSPGCLLVLRPAGPSTTRCRCQAPGNRLEAG
jgi:hypothetical protein